MAIAVFGLLLFLDFFSMRILQGQFSSACLINCYKREIFGRSIFSTFCFSNGTFYLVVVVFLVFRSHILLRCDKGISKAVLSSVSPLRGKFEYFG